MGASSIVAGEFIVSFGSYLRAEAAHAAVHAALHPLHPPAGSWHVQQRRNPAAAFPSDFAVVRLIGMEADLHEEAIAALRAHESVRSVAPQRRLTHARRRSPTPRTRRSTQRTSSSSERKSRNGGKKPTQAEQRNGEAQGVRTDQWQTSKAPASRLRDEMLARGAAQGDGGGMRPCACGVDEGLFWRSSNADDGLFLGDSPNAKSYPHGRSHPTRHHSFGGWRGGGGGGGGGGGWGGGVFSPFPTMAPPFSKRKLPDAF